MESKNMLLNSLLAGVSALALLMAIICKAVWPSVVLPEFDILCMAALTLIAFVLEYYIAPGLQRHWMVQIALAAVTFGILPWAAGFVALDEAFRLAIGGGIVFGCLTCVFTSMTKRMAVTGVKKAAVIPTAFVLYLACQGFMGMV